jgi:hypothetical protein
MGHSLVAALKRLGFRWAASLAAIFVIGAAAVAELSQALIGSSPEWVIVAWAVLIGLSSLMGLIGIASGSGTIQSRSIIPIACGLAVYMIAIIKVQGIHAIPEVLFLGALILNSIERMKTLKEIEALTIVVELLTKRSK